MPRESAIPIDLPSLDDLFTTQAERDEVGCEKVGVIPLYMIDPFPDPVSYTHLPPPSWRPCCSTWAMR